MPAIRALPRRVAYRNAFLDEILVELLERCIDLETARHMFVECRQVRFGGRGHIDARISVGGARRRRPKSSETLIIAAHGWRSEISL